MGYLKPRLCPYKNPTRTILEFTQGFTTSPCPGAAYETKESSASQPWDTFSYKVRWQSGNRGESCAYFSYSRKTLRTHHCPSSSQFQAPPLNSFQCFRFRPSCLPSLLLSCICTWLEMSTLLFSSKKACKKSLGLLELLSVVFFYSIYFLRWRGSHFVAQDGVELLATSDPSTSAFQSTEIIGLSYHNQSLVRC